MVEEQVLYGGMAAVPIIVPILQAVKGLIKKVWPNVPSDVWPFCAIALGVGWQFFVTGISDEISWRETAVLGVIIGLAASGLYSPLKTALTEVRERVNGNSD